MEKNRKKKPFPRLRLALRSRAHRTLADTLRLWFPVALSHCQESGTNICCHFAFSVPQASLAVASFARNQADLRCDYSHGFNVRALSTNAFVHRPNKHCPPLRHMAWLHHVSLRDTGAGFSTDTSTEFIDAGWRSEHCST